MICDLGCVFTNDETLLYPFLYPKHAQAWHRTGPGNERINGWMYDWCVPYLKCNHLTSRTMTEASTKLIKERSFAPDNSGYQNDKDVIQVQLLYVPSSSHRHQDFPLSHGPTCFLLSPEVFNHHVFIVAWLYGKSINFPKGLSKFSLEQFLCREITKLPPQSQGSALEWEDTRKREKCGFS